MKTMLLTLDDPRFKKSAAITLFATQKPEGPEGCNKALWDEIYKTVLAVAEENQWQLTGK